MAITETIPVTIETDAAARVEELGRQAEFRLMLDQCKRLLSGLRSIDVELAYDPCGVDDPKVLINAHRDDPGPAPDEAEARWDQWFLDTFPPKLIIEFGMMSYYGGPDGR